MGIFAGVGAGTAIGTVAGGFSSALNRGFNNLLPLSLPDAITLVNLRRRGEITQEKFLELMKHQGFDEEQSENITTAQQQILNINENITLYRRGLLGTPDRSDDTVFFDNMSKIGVQQDIAQKLLEANEVIPSVQDLIRFLVREVYTSSVRTKFGYDEDFPTAAIEQGKKIGIQPQTMRDYWAAHWQLPGVSQMYEALHRFNPRYISRANDDLNAIGLTEDEVTTDVSTVEEFLKVADYPDYFRKRLLATSYNNMTRVDVRRMIRLQLLDYDDAEYQYLKQGYYPRDSRRLTKFGYVYESINRWKDEIKAGTSTMSSILLEARQWHINDSTNDAQEAAENARLISAIKREIQPTIDEVLLPERDLAKSEILKAYELDILTEIETIQYLENLGYDNSQAIFILDVRKAQLNSREEPGTTTRQLTKTDILNGYREGVFNQDQTIEELTKYGLSREDASTIVQTYTRKYFSE